jgi:hypothetical protein
MAYARRDIRGGAVQTTITGSITNADVSCVIASSSGWPDGSTGGFFIVIDPGNASEEKILCSTRSGTTVNFTTRGADGTSASAHTSGAVLYPCVTKTDLDEANYAVSQTVGLVAAQGDILVGSSANTLSRVAKGTSGLPLVAGASTLSYAALGSTGLATDSVTATQIAAGAVGSSEIASAAVTAGAIAAGGVSVATQIAAGIITDVQVAAANKDGVAGTASLRTIGTAATQACAGNDARLSDTRTPASGSITTTAQFGGSNIAAIKLGTDGGATGIPGNAGNMYFAGDTLLLYISDGTAWVCVTPQSASVATSQTTTSTSYTDLATSGPAVTVKTDSKALVTLTCLVSNNGTNNNSYMGFAVSGATTVAAADTAALRVQASSNIPSLQLSVTIPVTGLTAGSNTFTAKYRVDGGTGTWQSRSISVVGIPG